MNINELIEKEGRDYMYSPKAHTGHYTDVQIEEYRYDGFVDGANFTLSQFRWRKVEEEDDESIQPPKFKEVYIKTNWDRVTSGILGHSNWNLDFDLGKDEHITHWMPIPE